MAEKNDKEYQILQFIRQSIEKDGFAPTIRDICRAVGIRSTSTVHSYLQRLEEQGLLQRGTNKSRAVRLGSTAPDEEPTRRVPILGRVTAGAPILAVENYDGYVDFPSVMARGRMNLFALRVMGKSMIEAGILDGDIVVVESGHYADNGDIVVAMIEDSATVKRFFREEDHIRLQPENSSMQPIIVKEVVILGKVIANFRFY